MNLLTLLLDQVFEIWCLVLVKVELLSEGAAFDFQIVNLLLHEILVLLKLRAKTLEAFLGALLIHVHLTVVIDFNFELVPLLLDFFHGFVGQFELVGQVVDVAFQRLDLRDIVLLLLVQLFNHELRPAHIFLHVQTFLVKFVVFFGQLLDGFLVALAF